MDTYTTGRSRTGHYRKPGSHLTYCGRTAGTPSNAARMCRPCVKAEALDRAEATATAEAWLDTAPAEATQAAHASADRYISRNHPRVADLLDLTPAAETAGTWRAEWISSRAASAEPTLFDVEPDTEQGALFA